MRSVTRWTREALSHEGALTKVTSLVCRVLGLAALADKDKDKDEDEDEDEASDASKSRAFISYSVVVAVTRMLSSLCPPGNWAGV
jgi:hypothetical protein